MGNIKATLQGGLNIDYGIFNLDANMLFNIKVDIITSGGQYVESLEAGYLHGGNNGLRDHEGIKSIDFAIPNWENYGPILATKLTNYYKNRITSMGASELWLNYSIYGNQFSVEFDKEEGEEDQTYAHDSTYAYKSYTNEDIPFGDRHYKTYSLSTLYASGVEMKAYIIHFSKYYYVYNTVSGSQLTLRPLLYYLDDLTAYNMGIYEETPQGSLESIGIPYVNTLLGLEWRRDIEYSWGVAGTRYEYIYHTVRTFDNTSKVYGEKIRFCEDDESSGSGHDWSMLASNPGDRPTFENYSANAWNAIPEGFSLWGLGGGHQYYLGTNNKSEIDDRANLPSTYLSVFNPTNKKRYRNNNNGGYVHSSDGGDDSFLGVMFRWDKNNNHHIFNTYFPVKGNEANYGSITLEIKYTNASNPPYPKYVGMVLASILTSIYVYGDEPSATIKYVLDIVYLEDHSTIYTKDIIYRAYVLFEEGSASTNNDLLLMRGSSYSTYLDSLKGFISEDDDEDNIFNENNVNLDLKECVKNVPLQFKLNYLLPELNIIGEKSAVKVLNIDGTSFDVVSSGVKPNELYFIDSNNQIQFFRNAKAFRINWLKSLKILDDRLIGEYDKSLQPTDNPYLGQSINFEEGKLGFKTSSLTSYTNGACYSIRSQNGSYGNHLYDLLINDILVPTAKIT